MSITELLFWLAAAISAYVYVGYPFVVLLVARLAPKPVRKADQESSVTILIAAYNESRYIAATLHNKLALDYPSDKLQIIVVSDGSTDGTDDIVRTFAPRHVLLLRQEPRNGKTSALNLGVQHATGEVLVFADANSLYDGQAIRRLVSNFADPTVGYVTGRLGYLNPDGSITGDGCSRYMLYENFIRRCESATGSLVGVNGGIDAVRTSLYEPMKADDLPDFVLPLRVVAKGFRVIYEPSAMLSESANTNARDEYRMRVRVALRALWTMAEMPELLNPWRHGFYAVQLVSHKALRYLAFVFIVTAFAASAVLWPVGVVYRIAFVAQVLFYIAALLGYITERAGRQYQLLSIPYYFTLVNMAALQAFVKFIKGDRHRVWKPRLG